MQENVVVSEIEQKQSSNSTCVSFGCYLFLVPTMQTFALGTIPELLAQMSIGMLKGWDSKNAHIQVCSLALPRLTPFSVLRGAEKPGPFSRNTSLPERMNFKLVSLSTCGLYQIA